MRGLRAAAVPLVVVAGASRSILITYLVPALALGSGAILLDEPVTVAVAGLVLVLGGVALGTGVARPLGRRAPVASRP